MLSYFADSESQPGLRHGHVLQWRKKLEFPNVLYETSITLTTLVVRNK